MLRRAGLLVVLAIITFLLLTIFLSSQSDYATNGWQRANAIQRFTKLRIDVSSDVEGLTELINKSYPISPREIASRLDTKGLESFIRKDFQEILFDQGYLNLQTLQQMSSKNSDDLQAQSDHYVIRSGLADDSQPENVYAAGIESTERYRELDHPPVAGGESPSEKHISNIVNKSPTISTEAVTVGFKSVRAHTDQAIRRTPTLARHRKPQNKTTIATIPMTGNITEINPDNNPKASDPQSYDPEDYHIETTTSAELEVFYPPYSLYKNGTYRLDPTRPHQDWLTSDRNLPYDPVQVKMDQIERHKLVAKTCSNIDTDQSYPGKVDKSLGRVGRSMFARLENLLYCPILKAGSTNILRLMCWKLGPPCTDIPDLKPHNNVPTFLERNGSTIAQPGSPVFPKYFSFAIVRNPWKRLVSVYIQKFVETKQGINFCQLKQRHPLIYMRCLRTKQPLPFVTYIKLCVIGQYDEGMQTGGTVRKAIGAQNGHWSPQYHMCSFCHLDFTFIGKMESMSVDERVILHEFGFEDIDKTIQDAKSKLLPNEKANKTAVAYEDLWARVPQSDMERLVEIFDIDFVMFNYPTSPFS